jgi:hypothetical protein
MTRLVATRTAHARSQRRLLAAGARIRGQWRYLVRTTRDPFGEMSAAAAQDATTAKRRCERVQS